jgi:hypothetical protein
MDKIKINLTEISVSGVKWNEGRCVGSNGKRLMTAMTDSE